MKSLLDPITSLKGIGPKTADRFHLLGIETVYDLLFHFPFRYEDISERSLESILDGEKVTLKGQVVTPPVVNYYGHRKNRLNFQLALADGPIIQVVFFNQAYLAKQIELGQEQAVYGKWQADRQNLLGMKMIKHSKEGQGFDPVYNSTKGLKQNQIIKAIHQAYQDYQEVIPELIPQTLNDKYRLMSLREAIGQMHFPQSRSHHKQAVRKIIYLEFFLYQWRIQKAQHSLQGHQGIEVHYDNQLLKEYIQAIPYELTQAQKQVVNEICRDLLSAFPMKRMLQGDVGSGKTLVAFIAMLATLTAGFQSVLMVPTEILATQHQESFNELFEAVGLHMELLVSQTPNKEKQETIEGLASGRIRLVVGTHALIQDSVTFRNLGLVIIDEQHRFGVGQRQALLDKGQQGDRSANLLQMTATPIPRSLALSIYGEMSVSTIDELPSGRQPIHTCLVKEGQIETVYNQMEQELARGHQVYYVLPLISESEEMADVENVEATYSRLKERFPHYQIGLLHGQLSKQDQTLMMQAFEANQTQILVATTMVEVGVNVPNATIMVIQSAERFGLAQLHQLRGRVGRSDLASYCYLIANPTTDQGKQRMQIMVDSQDGFYISQEDMKIRGMGDILGHAQSGFPSFKYANLFEDQIVLEVARKDVQEIIKHPYLIEEEEYKRIIQWVQTDPIEL
ncbi:ATP-dependent DNA helicase RecG [Hutsoniella sourekii]|uniref:ATP-dependent DNA helicase RecG n=1 Tax=Hutsoniella sourekii TaxID=87650 RepID=UPI000480FB16|nr:ATP-dependent DNA helicase RecG [Hutsoniella sourekii]